MASFEEAFGKGSAAYQLFVWSVVNQVLSALLSPAFTELAQGVNERAPAVAISPADAAKGVVRNYVTSTDGQAEAAKSGIDAARFATLTHLAGVAPGPQQLAEALRRGAIPETGSGADSTSFEQGVRETDLLDKWTPVIKAISTLWPSPADIIDAVVKNQIPTAEGQATYQRVGGDPQWYELLVNTNGNPPSPTELLELAQRQVIPWHGIGPQATTFQQGIYEGRSKDKWEPVYELLNDYFPTVSEIVELYKWGQLDVPTATKLMAQRGLSADYAAKWIAYANANDINDYRGLTIQAILAMLSLSYISDAQARIMLTATHHGTAAIDELIQYGHIQRTIQSANQSISRVGNLYQGRKITAESASNALKTLGVEPAAIPQIISDWDAIVNINVKLLTAAEIADAWEFNIMDDATAFQELSNIGYTPYDAWVYLSIKNKGPLPNQPAAGPGAPLGTVTPGAT
jgi:hypothetical protein